MTNQRVFTGGRLRRLAAVLPGVLTVLLLAACGSGQPSTTTTSELKNRSFITNTFSGNLQIVDTQNDTTAYTQQTTNSAGQIVPGEPVTIAVSSTVTLEAEGSSHVTTAVYDPSTFALYFITNSTEMVTGNAAPSSAISMMLYSTDSSTVYAAEPTLSVSGVQRLGGIEAFNATSFGKTATYAVPSARYLSLSPSGQYLFVFANNSDSLWLINLQATSVVPVEIPGFARPISAFFSSDNNTAYVLNCGPECGSSGPASVAFLDLPSQLITGNVPVGGASVGLLNGTTLYVAGSPVPPGTTSTYDAVDVSGRMRLTPNSVAIGDGFHTSMALSTNKRLFIGASTCSNQVTGCLSVVDTTTNTAEPSLPPQGAVTALLAITNRDVVYAIEGGLLHIYSSDTDTLQGTQLIFTGALSTIVQVDP